MHTTSTICREGRLWKEIHIVSTYNLCCRSIEVFTELGDVESM